MKKRNLSGHGRLAAIISICLFLTALLPLKDFAQSGGKWATGGNSISSTEFFGTLNNAPIVFKTLNTEKMRLLSNGYLGIGVTDPEAMLHVDGTIRFNSLNGTANGLVVANKFGTLQRISFTGNNRHVLLGDGTFAPYSDDDWLVSGNNMTTIPTGNVGIGVNTFSGNYKLEVGGDVKINGGLTVREITAENGKLVFNNTDLYTDGFLLVDNITSSAGTINFNNSNITTTGSISANNLIFTGIPTFENLTINGLTTTNALNVNENINVSNMLNFTGPTPSIYAQGDLNIGSGQDIILSTSSKVSMPEAKLGIGVFNPTETLDVGGNANIRGTLYVQNGVIIGQRMESDVIDVVEIIRAPILELSESLFIEHELTVPTAHMQNLSIDGQNSKITSTSGSINFDNENLNTTGAINAGSLQANALTVIGNSTLEGSLTTGIVDALEVNAANIRSSMGIQTDGNILSQSIETNDLTINGTTTINGEINIDELKVGTQIQVGSNSLFLSSGLNQDNSVENRIYTDNGDLKIQSNGGTNNTIINTGNNGKVGIGTLTPGFGYDNDGYGFCKLDVAGHGRFFGADQKKFLRIGYNGANAIIDGVDDINGALLINWYSGKNTVIGSDGTHGGGSLTANNDVVLAQKTGNVTIGSGGNPANLEVKGDLKLNNKNIYLKSGDDNHGLGYYNSTFASTFVDGPVLFGWSGGALGSRTGTFERIALQWTQDGKVGIGSPSSYDVALNVNGGLKLEGLNSSTDATAQMLVAGTDGIVRTQAMPSFCDAITCDIGKVGIGLPIGTLPQAELHIFKTSDIDYSDNPFPIIRVENELTSGQNYIKAKWDIVEESGNLSFYNEVLDDHGIPTIGYSNRLALLKDGRIGIGTSNSHIDNNLEVVNTIGLWSGSSSYSVRGQLEQNGHAMYIGENLFYRDGTWQKFQNDKEFSQIQLCNQGAINFLLGNNIPSNLESSIKMSIKENGNVGIGNDFTLFNGGGINVIGKNFYIEGSTKKINAGKSSAIYFTNDGSINFYTNATNGSPNDDIQWKSPLKINNDGSIIIGVNYTDISLKVNGTIWSNEVKIRTDHWSDFVFKPNYDLLPLNELESFIAKNKHLPDVPSEKEMLENGNDLGKTDALLLQKIEELTLYLLQLKNENQDLKARLDNIEKNHK